MTQRELIINKRLRAVENRDDHGTWMVFDLESGRRIVSSARLIGDLADILQPGMPRQSKVADHE